MASKPVRPDAPFARARRKHFAAHVSSLSALLAQQVQQLGLSMNTRMQLEEGSTPLNVAMAHALSERAAPFLGARRRALSREIEHQIAGMQRTISTLQAMARQEESL